MSDMITDWSISSSFSHLTLKIKQLDVAQFDVQWCFKNYSFLFVFVFCLFFFQHQTRMLTCKGMRTRRIHSLISKNETVLKVTISWTISGIFPSQPLLIHLLAPGTRPLNLLWKFPNQGKRPKLHFCLNFDQIVCSIAIFATALIEKYRNLLRQSNPWLT